MGTVISDGRATPTNATIRSTKRGAKGGKKGQKRRPPPHYGEHRWQRQRGNRELRRRVHGYHRTQFQVVHQTTKDHFEKILEAACPHHPYPIKHKLRDCTMMKRFMTSGAPPGGDEPASNSRGRGTMLVPGEVSYPGSKKQNRSLYTCVQDV
jgi:hypothetical protein